MRCSKYITLKYGPPPQKGRVYPWAAVSGQGEWAVFYSNPKWDKIAVARFEKRSTARIYAKVYNSGQFPSSFESGFAQEMGLMFVLSHYSKNSEAWVGGNLIHATPDLVHEALGLPPNEPPIDCHEVTEEIRQKIQPHVTHKINLKKYDYMVEL